MAYCGTVSIQLILLLSHTKCTNSTSCIKSCTKCGIVDGLAQVNQPCVIVVSNCKTDTTAELAQKAHCGANKAQDFKSS